MGDVGRPQAEIDWEKAEKLAGIHCTGEEIAAVLGVDYDTLVRRLHDMGYKDFADWYKKYSANGKMSLRRKQFEIAQAGDKTMLIWLGKQYLDQSDKKEVEQRVSEIKIDSDDADL